MKVFDPGNPATFIPEYKLYSEVVTVVIRKSKLQIINYKRKQEKNQQKMAFFIYDISNFILLFSKTESS